MKRILFLFATALTAQNSFTQNWLTTGNSGLTNANFLGTTDAKAIIFKTNNMERGRLLNGGLWRFGSAGNFLKVDTLGILSFESAAGYHVGGNRYAFQYSGDPDFGLFFNSTGSQYEFRDGDAVPVFYIKGNTGNFNFEGSAYNNGIKAISFDAGNNTVIGKNALISITTGSSNTATGFEALNNNTMGNYNTANGYHALYANTLGSSNVAIGLDVLDANTTGSYNVAIGAHALTSNSSGNDNTVTGYYASAANTTGSRNSSYGRSALYQTTTGGYNTAFGDSALFSNLTGNYNTALGYAANVSTTGLANATALGNGAIVDASNKVRVGNTAVTSVGGQVSWTTFSDKRFKKNLKENVQGLAFINKLRPLTYTVDINALNSYFHNGENQSEPNEFNEKAGALVHNGFLAQDVEEAAEKLHYDFSGVDKPQMQDGLYGLRYAEFVVPLVKAVQELSKMNDDKDAIIGQQNNKIGNLESRLAKLEAVINVQLAESGGQSATRDKLKTINLSAASLEENIPNPFNSLTTIHYILPQTFSSAKIIITDKSGKTLKEAGVAGVGRGTLNVDASTLSSGAYQYSLYVDGRLISTRHMLLIK